MNHKDVDYWVVTIVDDSVSVNNDVLEGDRRRVICCHLVMANCKHKIDLVVTVHSNRNVDGRDHLPGEVVAVAIIGS